MGKQSKNPPKKSNEDAAKDKTAKKMTPPFEISQEEYNDLLTQISELGKEELEEELILAARYGDMDVLFAILDNTKTDVNCQVAQNGNTPLHMAAANGHVAIVEKLLQHKAEHHIVNQAANTALHWASANGHDKVVEVLLKQVKDIDVLQKNQFGRSALTEGFTSQKTEVLKCLLEHDTASEEKLLQGTKQEEVDVEDTEEKNENKDEIQKFKKPLPSDGIMHEFNFLLDNNTDGDSQKEGLKIRELPIPATQDPFGSSPEKDTTGYGIWAASLVMARWMAASSERFRGKALLELGAGCGVPGLSAAFYRYEFLL